MRSCCNLLGKWKLLPNTGFSHTWYPLSLSNIVSFPNSNGIIRIQNVIQIVDASPLQWNLGFPFGTTGVNNNHSNMSYSTVGQHGIRARSHKHSVHHDRRWCLLTGHLTVAAFLSEWVNVWLNSKFSHIFQDEPPSYDIPIQTTQKPTTRAVVLEEVGLRNPIVLTLLTYVSDMSRQGG